ncbi:hypothetical protein Q75_07165 [Bacillus coahuilensis p1.1.43]|uniref:Cell wall-binding repeat 2 family protein n=1 Tax=Bacillus coahuilensis p1.1.43 TaxID=1150625 RepID=A0A147K946_9BACI|nr:hypothetical protein Q75_07165 [Bacillus coahuilensis p1.1.43]
MSYDTLIDDRVVSTTRLSGSSRYSTAVSISKQGFEKSDQVVIARGDSFPDALAGVPYAYKLNAPILLTNGSELPSDTINEIKRLEAKKVTILGGEAAVSTSVERYIKNTLKLSVERIAGTDRFETAVKINEKLTPTKNQAILVYGYNFPDALSIASYAAKNGIPIYLTDKETIPSITFNSIKSYKQTIIVGGTAVITNKVADKVNNPSRIGGKNRYDTAAKIYSSLMSPYNSDHVFFGNGNGFADSLTGSVLAAKYSAPLLLVEKDKLPSETSNVISKEMYYGYILGGEAVITNGLASEIKKQLMEAK